MYFQLFVLAMSNGMPAPKATHERALSSKIASLMRLLKPCACNVCKSGGRLVALYCPTFPCPRRFGQTKSTPLVRNSSTQSLQLRLGWLELGLNSGVLIQVPVLGPVNS